MSYLLKFIPKSSFSELSPASSISELELLISKVASQYRWNPIFNKNLIELCYNWISKIPFCWFWAEWRDSCDATTDFCFFNFDLLTDPELKARFSLDLIFLLCFDSLSFLLSDEVLPTDFKLFRLPEVCLS